MDQHQGAPDGSEREPTGGSAKQLDDREAAWPSEALSRSHDGHSTKACVMADGAGHFIAFRLIPGQAHELPHAVPLLDRMPSVPKWVVAGRGYTSHAFRQHIWDIGARLAIPPFRHKGPVACLEWIYNNQNRVERLWTRLKE